MIFIDLYQGHCYTSIWSNKRLQNWDFIELDKCYQTWYARTDHMNIMEPLAAYGIFQALSWSGGHI